MMREVSGSYDRLAQAQAVRARLEAIGVDPGAISVEERGADAEGKGIFDSLADYLLAEGNDRPGAFLVSAQVSPEQFDAAARIVQRGDDAPDDQGPFAPRFFVFPEHAERLDIAREVVVREEVILSKLVREHVEEIHDTVRKTEVEVERFSAGETGPRAGPG